ncbi:YchJ family protein [Zhongshania sp. BJYM1]|uniref:YchJ family protein n=1 Tax=Zhongshania aquatica TaxID=2965069 RepID=UPI0022B4075E|nr:YchJ family protein [Marortus sp. BJYM1]
MTVFPIENHCYCGNAKPFTECCYQYISGNTAAPTAETLMRSRFSAFCIKDPDYLLETLHKDPRAKESRKALLRSFGNTQWRSLKIIRSHQGAGGQRRGAVEFAAFFVEGEKGGQLHERSRFEFEDGRWFYTDGDILPPITVPRNEPCWCGSGRKLKKCHPD